MAGIIAKQYQDEEAARKHLEKLLWPDGTVCPHCGIIGEAYKLEGETTRDGLWKCSACRKPFTVTIGTIFEDSHIPLHKWLLAIHLMCSSKKGVSAHQLWRNLWGVDENGKQLGSYRTAWFMAHRIRWALGQEPMAAKLKGIVEVDDTWIGGKKRFRQEPGKRGMGPAPGQNPHENKTPVVAVLERDGNVKSYHMERVTSDNLRPILRETVEFGAHLMSDTTSALRPPKQGPQPWLHHTVAHVDKEYVRHENGLTITTNTVEGYFGIIKRGLNGIYHHVGRQYLDQYLREFDFRYNVRKLNDTSRAILAVKKTSGKRLMLKNPKSTP